MISRITLIAILTLGVVSCKNGNSVFDPDYEPSKPNPVITNILPEGRYLAGVDSVIVRGENFSSDIDSMTINFGGAPGVIKRASSRELIVRPGYKTGDNLDVRVSVRGAEYFSNSFSYTLDSAETNHPGLSDNYRPVSVFAIDADESIYGRIDIQGSVKFRKITKNGQVSVYSDTTRFGNYTGAKFGPDGGLYLISPETPNAAIFRMPPGGNPEGTIDEVWAYPPLNEGAKFYDLVFDGIGHIWVVGNNTNIYRFTFSDKSIKRYSFTANLRSVFVYENKLYVAGNEPGSVEQKVWMFPIDGTGNLGNASEILNLSGKYQGMIRAINFDSEGNMYLGIVDGDYGILKVTETGKVLPFYQYVLQDNYYSLVWDEEGFIIGARRSGANGTLLLNKIDMFDKERSTLYGL